MSIYGTTSWQKIPDRDGYGNELPDAPMIEVCTDYTISPGIVALRLDWQGSREEWIHFTIEETHELIAGLERAIRRETEDAELARLGLPNPRMDEYIRKLNINGR